MRGGWSRFQEPNIRQHRGTRRPRRRLASRRPRWATSGGASYLPRFDFDSLSDIGENIGATTIHSIYSFQPTLHADLRRHSLRAGYDVRLYREDGIEPGRAAGQYDFRTNYTRQARELGRPLRSGRRQLPARPPDRRLDRSQRRAPERHLVPRHVRAGRLEGHQQADGEPRPALRVRGRDDRLGESQRPRVRSRRRRSASRRRRAPPMRASPIPELAPLGLQRPRRPGSSRPTATRASTTPTATTFSRASGSPTRSERQDRGAWRRRRLRVPNIIFGNFQPGYSQSHADRADARQRPDVPRQSDQPVPRRRRRIRSAPASAPTRSWDASSAASCRSTSTTRRTCATS